MLILIVINGTVFFWVNVISCISTDLKTLHCERIVYFPDESIFNKIIALKFLQKQAAENKQFSDFGSVQGNASTDVIYRCDKNQVEKHSSDLNLN